MRKVLLLVLLFCFSSPALLAQDALTLLETLGRELKQDALRSGKMVQTYAQRIGNLLLNGEEGDRYYGFRPAKEGEVERVKAVLKLLAEHGGQFDFSSVTPKDKLPNIDPTLLQGHRTAATTIYADLKKKAASTTPPLVTTKPVPDPKPPVIEPTPQAENIIKNQPPTVSSALETPTVEMIQNAISKDRNLAATISKIARMPIQTRPFYLDFKGTLSDKAYEKIYRIIVISNDRRHDTNFLVFNLHPDTVKSFTDSKTLIETLTQKAPHIQFLSLQDLTPHGNDIFIFEEKGGDKLLRDFIDEDIQKMPSNAAGEHFKALGVAIGELVKVNSQVVKDAAGFPYIRGIRIPEIWQAPSSILYNPGTKTVKFIASSEIYTNDAASHDVYYLFDSLSRLLEKTPSGEAYLNFIKDGLLQVIKNEDMQKIIRVSLFMQMREHNLLTCKTPELIKRSNGKSPSDCLKIVSEFINELVGEKGKIQVK